MLVIIWYSCRTSGGMASGLSYSWPLKLMVANAHLACVSRTTASVACDWAIVESHHDFFCTCGCQGTTSPVQACGRSSKHVNHKPKLVAPANNTTLPCI